MGRTARVNRDAAARWETARDAERDGRRRAARSGTGSGLQAGSSASRLVYRPGVDLEKLRQIPFFEHLHDHTLARIAELSTEFEVPAGWVLVEVGQPGSGMFFLEEGTVQVETPGGRSWEYGPGEFFGELALLTDHPRNARIRAKTPVRCLAISRMDFQKLLDEEPEIAVAMLPKLAARIDAPH